MERPHLKEKLKRSVCLFFAAVMILSLVISTGNAFAANTSTPVSTAVMKMYYQFLRDCIKSSDLKEHETSGGIFVFSTEIKNGELFTDAPLMRAYSSGMAVEEDIVGHHDDNDGKLRCGENGNKLLSKALEVLNIGTISNLICNYQDPDSPGIMRSQSSSCINDLNVSSMRYFKLLSSNERVAYFNKLVEEKTGLTQNDLQNYTNGERYAAYTKTFLLSCADESSTARLDNPERYEFQVMVYNTSTQQFVRAGYSSGKKNKKVYLWPGSDELSCGEIANALDEGGNIYNSNKDSLVNQINGGTSPTDLGVITEQSVAGRGQNDDLCYDKAGVIGWILCPIVSTASSLLESTYETIEKEYLQIDAINLFNRRNDGGIVGVDPVPDSNIKDESTLHIIWSAFRDIANIAFVIFLLVVILSQVTGIGIDNYGIKKILPRLIVVALLVNLSYFICEFAVDLSNIVGIGIKDVFNNFTNQITTNTAAATGADGAQNVVVMGSLMAIGIGVLLVSPGLILTLACFLITMVISVLFLWIILICRQAGLILAIGLAPLAFICYLFPNTEKLFKRWVNLMKSLLLLYPICSFVICGGMLAGRVFASMNNAGDGESTGLTLAAMIVPVIPYLFIPSLLRNSINAMGKLGTTISHLGRQFNQGTVGRFQKSDTEKRARTAMNTWDAGGLRSRISATKFGKFTGLQQSTARKIAAREKMKNDDRMAQALLQREKFARLEQRNPNNVSLQAFEAQLDAATTSVNGGERYDAILSEIERRFGSSKAADLAMKTIDKNQNSALLAGKNRQEFMRKLAQNHQSTFSKAPDFGKYLQYGGVHRNSVTGATTNTSFAGANADASHNFLVQDVNVGDFKDNQITASNSNSVYRMINAGKITQADAARIMANDDIRGSMDSVQQAILAASYNRNGVIGAAMNLPKQEVEAAFAGRTTWMDENGAVHPVRITQAQANALVA